LYSVADLLSRENSLRTTLADAGLPEQARRELTDSLLEGRVGSEAIELVRLAVSKRWSDDGDLVAGLEALAARVAFSQAQVDGTLDATEEEIFRFGRAVDASADLQMALTDPALSAAVKAKIVDSLLEGRTSQATRQVLGYMVGHLHGARLDAAIDELTRAAADQRERVVAEVRVAAPLEAEQERRLSAALATMTGRQIRLNVSIDPSVLGGVHVTIGDEIIDGTVATRLVQARRALLGTRE
jgi:F-type H+-transporting ATPase subunit delta